LASGESACRFASGLRTKAAVRRLCTRVGGVTVRPEP
jgi:hypothetical protein